MRENDIVTQVFKKEIRERLTVKDLNLRKYKETGDEKYKTRFLEQRAAILALQSVYAKIRHLT